MKLLPNGMIELKLESLEPIYEETSVLIPKQDFINILSQGTNHFVKLFLSRYVVQYLVNNQVPFHSPNLNSYDQIAHFRISANEYQEFKRYCPSIIEVQNNRTRYLE